MSGRIIRQPTEYCLKWGNRQYQILYGHISELRISDDFRIADTKTSQLLIGGQFVSIPQKTIGLSRECD